MVRENSFLPAYGYQERYARRTAAVIFVNTSWPAGIPGASR